MNPDNEGSSSRDIAHLRDYVDTRFGCLTRESDIATAELARRLDALNHAHDKAVEVQHAYVPREVFDRFVDSYEQRHTDVTAAIQQLLLQQTSYLSVAAFDGYVLRQDKEKGETRRAVYSTMVMAGVALLGVATQFLR